MGIVIRQSIKGTVVNYVGAFIGFLTTMLIATRWLKEEEIGLLRVLFEVAALLASFAQLGIISSAIRFFPYFKSKDGRNNGFFFYLMAVPFVGMLIVIPLYVVFEESILGYFMEKSPLLIDYANWIIPFTLLLVYLSVFETYANLLMRIAIPKFIREVVIRLLVVLLYLLYGFRLIELTPFVISYVAIYGIAMGLNFWYVSRIGSVSMKHYTSFVSPELRKQIFRYSAFLVVSILGTSITSKLDLFMVSGEMGLNYAGIYTIALFMAAIVEIPSRSITAISAPLASAALQAGDFQQANNLYKKVSLHQLLIGGAVFLLLWINIDNIYDIMPNGDNYRGGKWVVFFIGVSRLIMVFLGFGYTLISYSKYYYWGLYFTFFITAITILLNIWLIPIWGMTGAAIAALFSVMIGYGVQQWLVFAKVKGNPYTWNTLKVVIILGVLFGINSLIPEIGNVWFDALLRSMVVSVAGVVMVYYAHLSEELDQLFSQALSRFRKR